MDQAIENVMRIAGVSIEEAVAMATTNPARLCRIGEHNDTVEFRLEAGSIQVLETRVDGKVAFPDD